MRGSKPYHSQFKKRVITAGVTLTLAVGSQCAFAGTSNKVVLAMWGGSIQRLWTKVVFKPFEKATGIHVVADSTSSIGKAEAMAKSGHVQWDVFMASDQDLAQAKKDKILIPINYQIVPKKNLVKSAPGKYGVAAYTYATVMTYNTDQIKNPPHSWKDWWNTKKYSCARTMRNEPVDNLEAAEMAAGTSPGNVYPINQTKAYKALNKVQNNVVNFWKSGAQSIQLVANGTACLGTAWNDRVVAAIQGGQPIDFVWNQAIVHHDYYTVMKGAKHPTAAMKLIAYAMRPDVQAKIANAMGLLPVNKKADHMMSKSAAKYLPTKKNLKNVVHVDLGWWRPNEDAAFKRFNQWMVQ